MYVGVDVAKDFHVAALSDFDRALEFGNDAEGFALFMSWLADSGAFPDETVVCLEATGSYWRSLVRHLTMHGYPVAVVNPMRVSAFRKASIYRDAKTDRLDAQLIADYARFMRLSGDVRSAAAADALKRLTRYRAGLVKIRTEMRNRLAASANELFPEIPRLLGGTSTASFLVFAQMYAGCSSMPTDSALAEILSAVSRGRYGRDKAREVIDAIRHTVGDCEDAALIFEVSHLAKVVSEFNARIAEVDSEIKGAARGTACDLLITLPGVGVLGAATILGELGDLSRFPNGKSVMAYAGMDATVRQSGQYDGRHARMSKRGSAYLRRVLMLCADAARRNDAYFGDYYNSLIDRGKHHYVAVSAVARKLCNVMLVIAHDNRPYESAPPSI